MHNQEKYRQYFSTREDIPFYLRPDWLDVAAHGNEWGVAMTEKGGDTLALMPWFLRKKWGMSLSYQPFLIPYLGPIIRYPDGQKISTRLSWEKELMDDLIRQLPKTGFFRQSFRPDIINWLPFYWKGFGQSTRYSYRLNLAKSEADLWGELRDNIRREIRKAKKNVTITSSNDLDPLLQLKHQQAKVAGKPFHIPDDYARKLFELSKINKQAKLWYAKNDQNIIHAGLWTTADAENAIYMMGGSHPDFKQSAAMSLLMWTAILEAKNQTAYFDFEGSMIKSVERFFRGFGAEQVPYFEISKISNPLFYLWMYFKK